MTQKRSTKSSMNGLRLRSTKNTKKVPDAFDQSDTFDRSKAADSPKPESIPDLDRIQAK